MGLVYWVGPTPSSGSCLVDSRQEKMPVMILDWQPVMGRGTSKSVAVPAEMQEAPNEVYATHRHNVSSVG